MPDYKRTVGASLSRANSLRPLHSSLRRYYAAASVLSASLGGLAFLNTVDELAAGRLTVGTFGRTILGVGFLLTGALAFVRLLADCLRRWALEGLPRKVVRSRLQSLPRDRYFEANPNKLRGMIIGAVFFGGCLVFAIAVRAAGIAPG